MSSHNNQSTDEIFAEVMNEESFSSSTTDAISAEQENINDWNQFPEAAAPDELSDEGSFIDEDPIADAFPAASAATQRIGAGMLDIVHQLFGMLLNQAAVRAPAAPPLRRTSSASVLWQAPEEDDEIAERTPIARARSANDVQVNNSPAPVEQPETFDFQSVLARIRRAFGELIDDDDEDVDNPDEDNEEDSAIRAIQPILSYTTYDQFLALHWQTHLDRQDRLAFLESITSTGRVHTEIELHERLQLRATDLRFFHQACFINATARAEADGRPLNQYIGLRDYVEEIVEVDLYGGNRLPGAVVRGLAALPPPAEPLIDVPTPGDMRLVETVAEYDAGEKCTICLELIRPVAELGDDEREEEMPARLMTCGHYFHHGCVKSWLVDRKTCPLCRKRVEAEE